jgi:carbamoyl-phosphate synthase large subunit
VFQKYDIRGVFNIAASRGKTLLDKDYVMRRNAVDFGVPLFMEPKVCYCRLHEGLTLLM